MPRLNVPKYAFNVDILPLNANKANKYLLEKMFVAFCLGTLFYLCILPRAIEVYYRSHKVIVIIVVLALVNTRPIFSQILACWLF